MTSRASDGNASNNESEPTARKSATIITCAVTGGGAITAKSGAVPITPQQIADQSISAAKSGASIVHIHVRHPETGAPSMELSLYREVVDRIRQSGVDVLINLTTGAGARFVPGVDDPRRPADGTTLASPEARVRHILELRPEICTLDVATMNFGTHALINTPDHITQMAAMIRSVGTLPELEVFDLGHLELAKRLIRSGAIGTNAYFQLCLGIPGGAPATPEAMVAMYRLIPARTAWSGFGISAACFPMVAQAAVLGGHVRVGLEDNLYLARGKLAPDNQSLVRRAVDIVQAIGMEVATAEDAREILRVPQR